MLTGTGRVMTGEPSPIRDDGRYRAHGQARAQYAATAYGIPARTTKALAGVSSMVLAEALLLAGVETYDFESVERDSIARQLDPHTVQVVAGWVIRARLAGGPVRGSDQFRPDEPSTR